MEILTDNIYNFSSKEQPSISEVGGKGYSLIKMTQFGLKIPPGFILSASFFTSWVDEIKHSQEWSLFLNSKNEEEQIKNIRKLKELCFNLSFTKDNLYKLEKVIETIPIFNSQSQLYAVRSSSPEEDLSSASFAGMYETLLGVNKQSINDAIKRVFSSCLDYRIIKYKEKKGIYTHY